MTIVSASGGPIRRGPVAVGEVAVVGGVLDHAVQRDVFDDLELSHSLLLSSVGIGKRSWIHACHTRCLAGDGCGRLIAVQVEVHRHHALATGIGDGAKGGDAWPRLVEPQQGVVGILGDVLHHAAER